MFKVFSADAAVKTHGAVDGTLFDLVNPLSLPADTITAVSKTAVAVAVGWVGHASRTAGKFALN